MFKCKCKSEHEILEDRIALLERCMNARTEYIGKLLNGVIDYLNIAPIPFHEKEQVPEVQFRKRKQVKQEK